MPAPGPTVDPLDAVLAGDDRPDLRDVAGLVDDLVAAYVPDEPLRRSEALAALTDPATRPTPTAVPARRRAVAGFGTVVATLGGKLVLGGAVAAAAVGGLHVTHQIDVPFIPDVGQDDTPASVETEPVSPADDSVRRDGPPGLDRAESEAPDRADDRIPDQVPANPPTPVPPGPATTGPPDGVGLPEDTGKPDDTGKPEDENKPSDSGKPSDTGKPDDASEPEPGQPDDTGRPTNVGKPEEPGRSGGGGKPEGVGTPDEPGRSTDAGPLPDRP